jgi:FtsX-like permease family
VRRLRLLPRAAVAAFQELSSSPLRSAITAGGLAVALAAFTLTVQLGQSAKEGVNQAVVLSQGKAGTIGLESTSGPLPTLLQAARTACAQSLAATETTACTPATTLPSIELTIRGLARSVQVVVVSPAIADVLPVRMQVGSWLNSDGSRGLALTGVVTADALSAGEQGAETALGLFGATGVVADARSLGLRVHIVGVVADCPLVRFLGNGPRIFVTARDLGIPPLLEEAGVLGDSVQTFASAPGDVDAAVTSLVQRQKLRLTSGGNSEAQVSGRRVDGADDFAAASGALARVLAGIAAISLLVGLVGVINIGLVGVRERTREFALRRAVGTPPFVISTMVLLESLILILGGSIIGIAIAATFSWVLATQAASLLNGIPLTPVELSTVFIGLAVGSISGLVAGSLPAMRARRLSVVSGLRG